jgi:hypothetical protein
LGNKVFVGSQLPAKPQKKQAYTSSANATGIVFFVSLRGFVSPHSLLSCPPNPLQRCFLTSASFCWGATAASCLAPPASRSAPKNSANAPFSVSGQPVRSTSPCCPQPPSRRRRGRVHSLRLQPRSAKLHGLLHFVRQNAPYSRNKTQLRFVILLLTVAIKLHCVPLISSLRSRLSSTAFR